MKKMTIAFFGLATLLGCAGPSTGNIDPMMIDGGLPDGSAGTDSGATDIDGGVVAQPDSGSQVDSGTQADSGSGTTSCLATDTDTGTYTFDIYSFSSQYPDFNLDGYDNTNAIAGCGGIGDTNQGYDNGFGDMIRAKWFTVDGTITNYMSPVSKVLRLQVTLTHVRSDIITAQSDPCVGVDLMVVTMGYAPSILHSETAVVNGRMQGSFDNTLHIFFPIDNTTRLAVDVLDPVYDFQADVTWQGLRNANSYVGGHVFFAPTDADTAAGYTYNGILSLDSEFTRIWGTSYSQGTRPTFFQYLDLHTMPDGTLNPCDYTFRANSLAFTWRFAP